MRYCRLGLKGVGDNRTLRYPLIQCLAVAEMYTGNLIEAKRLIDENALHYLRMRLAFYEGDWNAAGQFLQGFFDSSRGGGKGDELMALSFSMDFRIVTGDYRGAAAALERALSFYEPDDLYCQVLIRAQAVMLYFDAGHPEKAAEHLEYCHKILAGGEDWLGQAGHLWRAEAIGAALQERFEESDHAFEKSIEISKRYSTPLFEAETWHYWGKALLQRGQVQRAREKLDAALKLYRDHGSGQPWIDHVEADCRRATLPSAKPERQSGRASAGTAAFRNEGEFWAISYLDRSFRLRDMRGLHYIAYLLAHPNERFHVRELSASVGRDALPAATSGPGLQADREDGTPILDSKAKADYRARLSELRAELDEAVRMNDTGRAERIRQELEFVSDELSAAVALSGRDRKMADPAERARLRVGKAIRSALSAIREHDPSLARHLTTCIRTGYYCQLISGNV
jgi:tetratricopeptide (TPR) repeat protein